MELVGEINPQISQKGIEMHFFLLEFYLGAVLFSLHHFSYYPETPSTVSWPNYFLNSRIYTENLILQPSLKLCLTPAQA